MQTAYWWHKIQPHGAAMVGDINVNLHGRTSSIHRLRMRNEPFEHWCDSSFPNIIIHSCRGRTHTQYVPRLGIVYDHIIPYEDGGRGRKRMTDSFLPYARHTHTTHVPYTCTHSPTLPEYVLHTQFATSQHSHRTLQVSTFRPNLRAPPQHTSFHTEYTPQHLLHKTHPNLPTLHFPFH